MADAYLLENGTDHILLEDGSGILLMEVPAAEDLSTRYVAIGGVVGSGIPSSPGMIQISGG